MAYEDGADMLKTYFVHVCPNLLSVFCYLRTLSMIPVQKARASRFFLPGPQDHEQTCFPRAILRKGPILVQYCPSLAAGRAERREGNNIEGPVNR